MLPTLLFSPAVPPAGWTTCGGLDSLYNRTACPSKAASCVVQNWMPDTGHFGCCPYADGVDCATGYTCCPHGSSCVNKGTGWGVVSSCVDAASGKTAAPGADGGGQQVCKTGGPLPFSTTLKNVIILGDSVSIGYEPFVAAMMKDVALVQHSPWGGDGGAEETKYGFLCLDYLLRAPDGTPQHPDVLYWNFGLHNLNNNTDPGQSGPISEYAPYLDKIAVALVAWAKPKKTKLIFGITTPEMCSGDTDAVVQSNNKAAAAIMAKHGVQTVDMHAPIIAQCGASPQATCFNQTGCFCPHCPMSGGVGYQWLSKNVIVPAITKALVDDQEF